MSAVRDRRAANPKTPRCLDLVARFEKQSSSRCGVRVKIGEVFSILASQDHGRGRRALLQAKTDEAVIGEGQPVAPLGVFAFVNNVYSGLPLPGDDFSNRVVKRQLPIGSGKTTDVRRQDAMCAAIHG